ncbi:MAG: hypothetical protein LC774_15565 [Acidobacteria bacterium]|nr:hypothetical protein [Acidobacteriota bacterium]
MFVGEGEKAFTTENQRRDKLTDKSESLIKAVGLVMGFQLIDLKNLSYTGSRKDLGLWLAVGALLALSVALVLALLGARIRSGYKSQPREDDLVNALWGNNVSDDDAKAQVARTYFAAREENAIINDGRARLLAFSGYCLLAGFFMAVLSQVLLKLVK